jgi:hypothetical protein
MQGCVCVSFFLDFGNGVVKDRIAAENLQPGLVC